MAAVTAAEIRAYRARLAKYADSYRDLEGLYEETGYALDALGDGLTGPRATYWKVVDLRNEIEAALRAVS